MYQISTEYTKQIAGGVQTYVTQEWKDTQALSHGVGTGILTSAVITGVVFFEGISGFGAALIGVGGMMGYLLGYSMNTYQNALLKNNTWYDLQPIPAGFQRAA